MTLPTVHPIPCLFPKDEWTQQWYSYEFVGRRVKRFGLAIQLAHIWERLSASKQIDRQTPQSDLDGCVGNFSSWHPGGLNVCLMDGSVRFISENIESASEADLDALPSMTGPERRNVYGIWQALCDINDGMVIGEF
ncbi:MAG: DUF1559 domain-containing protein [Planctomycetaceae bacterium]